MSLPTSCLTDVPDPVLVQMRCLSKHRDNYLDSDSILYLGSSAFLQKVEWVRDGCGHVLALKSEFKDCQRDQDGKCYVLLLLARTWLILAMQVMQTAL